MFRLKDRLSPVGVIADALYVPGFCLTLDRKRLTNQNSMCMTEAIRHMNDGRAKYLIFSGCYSGKDMERELFLRRRMSAQGGVSTSAIREIAGILDTRDELVKLRNVLDALGAKSVMFVSDEWHMPRLVRWARILLPNMNIYHKSIRPARYEFTSDPGIAGVVKTIRVRFKLLWVLWNMIFYYATPLLVKREENT